MPSADTVTMVLCFMGELVDHWEHAGIHAGSMAAQVGGREVDGGRGRWQAGQ